VAMALTATGSLDSDHDEASSLSTSMPWGAPAGWGAAGPAVAGTFPTGAATKKLFPHFLYLIRAPIRLEPILPFSPQLGRVTDGIVPPPLSPAGSVAADRALRDMVHVSVTTLGSEREDNLDPTLHSKLDVTPPDSSRVG
jgi:hypothetical protein